MTCAPWSFHPNQSGHDAIGLFLAGDVITFTFGSANGNDGNAASGPSEWPTSDSAFDEGPSIYYTWLGSGFVFPTWVSCNIDYCIAGDGDAVLVTALNPLDDLATIDEDIEDPYAAFASARPVRTLDTVELLTPGDP